MVRKRDNLSCCFLLKEISFQEDCKNSEGEYVKVQALVSFFFCVIVGRESLKSYDVYGCAWVVTCVDNFD